VCYNSSSHDRHCTNNTHRFSNHPFFSGAEKRVRGRIYAQASAQLLDLRDISLQTIQACVLLGAFSIVEGEAAPEAVYYSVACRIAMLIDLPNAPVPTRLEQEVNRRGTRYYYTYYSQTPSLVFRS
jgi:hypothetical protein